MLFRSLYMCIVSVYEKDGLRMSFSLCICSTVRREQGMGGCVFHLKLLYYRVREFFFNEFAGMCEMCVRVCQCPCVHVACMHPVLGGREERWAGCCWAQMSLSGDEVRCLISRQPEPRMQTRAV